MPVRLTYLGTIQAGWYIPEIIAMRIRAEGGARYTVSVVSLLATTPLDVICKGNEHAHTVARL